MDELLRLGLRRNNPLVQQQRNATNPPNIDNSRLRNNSNPIPARIIPRPPPNSPAQRRPFGANRGRQALPGADPGPGTTQAQPRNRLILQITTNGQHYQQENGLAQEQPRPDLPGAQQNAPPGNAMQDDENVAAAAWVRPPNRTRTNAQTGTNVRENTNSTGQGPRVEQAPIPTQDEHEGAPPMAHENGPQTQSVDQAPEPQNRQDDPPDPEPLNNLQDPNPEPQNGQQRTVDQNRPADPEPLNNLQDPNPEPQNGQQRTVDQNRPADPEPLNNLRDPNREPQNGQQRTVNQNRPAGPAPQNRPPVAAVPRSQNRQQGMVRQTANEQQTPRYGPVFGPQNRPRRGAHPRPAGNQNRPRVAVAQDVNRDPAPTRPRYRPQGAEARRPPRVARGAQARSASEGTTQGNERISHRTGRHRISLDSRPRWRY